MCSLSFRRPGAQACRPERREAHLHIHQRPPSQRVPEPGLCAHMHTAPSGISPGCPGLLHTCLWPQGFSLRISDFTAPNPGLQHRWALGLGCTWGLLTLPSHLHSRPGLCPASIHRPGSTSSCPPRVGRADLDMDLHPACHTAVHVTPQCSSIRPSVLLPMGPGSETQLPSQKGKAEAWG